LLHASRIPTLILLSIPGTPKSLSFTSAIKITMTTAANSCGGFTGFRTGAGGGQPLRHPSSTGVLDWPHIPSLANVNAPNSVGPTSVPDSHAIPGWSPPGRASEVDESDVGSIIEGHGTSSPIAPCRKVPTSAAQSAIKVAVSEDPVVTATLHWGQCDRWLQGLPSSGSDRRHTQPIFPTSAGISSWS